MTGTQNQHGEEIYQEGYRAYHCGIAQEGNPFSDLDAEYWDDGWSDAQEDEAQS